MSMSADQMEAQDRAEVINDVVLTLGSIVRMCAHGYEDSQSMQFMVIKGAAEAALKRVEDDL